MSGFQNVSWRAALNHCADFPLEASASSRLDARPCTVERERVLGIDACKPGWIGVTLDDGGTSAYFSTQVSDLAGQAQADGPILVVAVDMPIGLPDRGRRAADVLAGGGGSAAVISVHDAGPCRA
jgi:predicted RNase H-like nuclease